MALIHHVEFAAECPDAHAYSVVADELPRGGAPDDTACAWCQRAVEIARDCYADTFLPGYGAGYEDGKQKAHWEMRQWRPGDHVAGCGCEPCITARVVLGLFEQVAAVVDGR